VTSQRSVAGVIDAPGAYTSTVAAGGGFAFLAGTAIDDDGRLALDAQPQGPYGGSTTARAHTETRFIYGQWKKALSEVGSSLADMVQIEQYVTHKVQAEAYFAEALGDDFLGTGTVNGATAQIGEYFPSGATICLQGLAVVPDGGPSFTKTFPLAGGSPTGKFADPVGGGPYLFTTMFPMDRAAEGLPADVRLPGWSWGGSEVASEAKWAVNQLRGKLESVGGTLADVVDYTLLLSDLDDLYEFDVVMRAALGDHAPTRTVVPMRGSALPRVEDAVGHSAGAARLEIQFRCLNAQAGGTKSVVAGSELEIGHQSAGIRVDQLLWLSSQCARPTARGNVQAEIDDVLEQLGETCERASTSLGNLLRLRVQVTDRSAAGPLFDSLRRAVPDNPPAVTVLGVDALPVPETTVAIDGVALVGS
jgi:enamine deaminase RidA (YjgF/YER057c/UK114 family)